MRKLLVIIAQVEDVEHLMDAIIALGERATHAASTGGFLRRESAVVLSCVAPHRVAPVLAAVQQTCHRRTTFVVPPALEYGPIGLEAVEIEIGGAVVFVLDVERATFLAMGADGVAAAALPTPSKSRV